MLRTTGQHTCLKRRHGGAQLADFGISRALMSEDFANLKTSSNNVQGTLRWMAIEQFSDTTPGAREQYSFATDIWSFGMTIYVRPARFCKPPPPRLREAPDLIYVRTYVRTYQPTGSPDRKYTIRAPQVGTARYARYHELQVTSSAGRAFARSRRGGAVVGVMSVMLACRPEVQADDHGSSRATARRMCLGASRGGFSPGPPGPGQRTVVPTRQLQHLGHCAGAGAGDYGHSATPRHAGPSSLSRLVRGSPAGERTRTEATRLDLTSIDENNRNRPDLQKTDLRMPGPRRAAESWRLVKYEARRHTPHWQEPQRRPGADHGLAGHQPRLG